MRLTVGQVSSISICAILLSWVVLTQFKTHPAPSPEPAAQEDRLTLKDVSAPLTPGPITYFLNHCTNCHGPTDTAYSEFATHRRGNELRRMLRVMAQGPGMAASDPQTLDEQYRLHMAMIDKQPYIWINPDRHDLIAGELVDTTHVYLQTSTGRIEATLNGSEFELPNLPGSIVIEREGQSLTIHR